MNTWSGQRQGQVCYAENGPEGDEIGGEAVTRCSCQVVHLGVQAHARENVPGTHPQSQGYKAGVLLFHPSLLASGWHDGPEGAAPEASPAEAEEVLGPKGHPGLRLPLFALRPRRSSRLRSGNSTA